jgi:hypothetical protein
VDGGRVSQQLRVSFTNAAGNTGASTTGSLLEHVIPSGELSAVASVDLGPARFTSEARAGFVDEDVRGAYYDEGAGYRYMTAGMASRQRERVLRNDVGLRVAGVGVDVGQESRFRTSAAAQRRDPLRRDASQAYRHELDVHAGYLAARRSVGGVRAEAGLRAEADRTRVRPEAAGARTASRFFPSVSGERTDARRGLVYRSRTAAASTGRARRC